MAHQWAETIICLVAVLVWGGVIVCCLYTGWAYGSPLAWLGVGLLAAGCLAAWTTWGPKRPNT